MKPPGKPANESTRLQALRDFHVLDTPPEAAFDDLTRLAAHILEVPIALVSLVDQDRQWFKSRFGLEAPETPREVSFCGHAVAAGQMLVVPDADRDRRFADNPLVTGEPRVRFYAGVPLVTAGGEALGTLCAIDHVARDPAPEKLEMLAALGRQVMTQLSLRREGIDRGRLIAVVEGTPDFVGIAELDGRLVYLNPAARASLGLGPDEEPPRDGLSFHPEWARKLILEQAIPAAIRDGSWIGETALVGRDGRELPVIQLILAQHTGDGKVGFLAAHARDISDRKKLEELKDEFVSMVSHELRTPLTSILGSLRLIEAGAVGAVSDEAGELIGIARQNSERLIRLINDILDLDKVEAGKLELRLEKVDPRALVERAVREIESVARSASVAIEVTLPDLPAMRADPERLLQVLTNLIGNALKFAPRSSRIRLSGEADPREVRISVEDQGPGIPDKDLPLLFGRFQQLDSSDGRVKGGTGLGLAISKAMVERHGGRIGVTSKLGEGARFWFAIPRDAG